MSSETLRDKIRKVLLSYGEQEISITTDDLIGKIGNGVKSSQIYYALYGMEQVNEITVLKEQQSNGRMHMIGVRILKSEGAEKINGRVSETQVKASTETKIKKFHQVIPETMKYARMKLGIEEAKKVLLQYSIPVQPTLNFEENPMGEEALLLLQKVEDQQSDIEALKIERATLDLKLQRAIARMEQPVAEGSKEVPISTGAHQQS